MSAAILAPKSLELSKLDDYLSVGWRPLGQRIYTADFIQLELGAIHSVIPTRMPLNGHSFKKKQRRLLRQNNLYFEVQIGKAAITAEMNRVNALYMELHPTKSEADLNIHLFEKNRRIFDTHQVSVFKDGKLVAFSFFDAGENSIYSKAGIYDPAFSSYSLGMYTMYLEIEWAKTVGKQFYYPGYVSPDIPLFDYKTKIGPIEFWHLLTKKWLPFTDFEDKKHNPSQISRNKLLQLKDALTAQQTDSLSKKYVFFEMNLMYNSHQYLAQPYFLYIHSPGTQLCRIVTYNIYADVFEFRETYFEERLNMIDDSISPKWPIFVYVLQQYKILHAATSFEQMATFISNSLKDQKQILSPIEG